jgi:hypothetical protein
MGRRLLISYITAELHMLSKLPLPPLFLLSFEKTRGDCPIDCKLFPLLVLEDDISVADLCLEPLIPLM